MVRALSAALAGCLLVLSAGPVPADLPTPEKFDDTGFVPIFNGKDLSGWTVSAKTGHSRASMNKSGGRSESTKGRPTE